MTRKPSFFKRLKYNSNWILLTLGILYSFYILRIILIKHNKSQTSQTTQTSQTFFLLPLLHLLLFTTFYNYFKVMFFNHTKVDFSYDDKRIDLSTTGGWKLCGLCDNQGARPKNTYHCKKCKTCRFDLDHHCPYTNSCVTEENMRWFLRFMVSATVLAVIGLIILVVDKVKYDQNDQNNQGPETYFKTNLLILSSLNCMVINADFLLYWSIKYQSPVYFMSPRVSSGPKWFLSQEAKNLKTKKNVFKIFLKRMFPRKKYDPYYELDRLRLVEV